MSFVYQTIGDSLPRLEHIFGMVFILVYLGTTLQEIVQVVEVGKFHPLALQRAIVVLGISAYIDACFAQIHCFHCFCCLRVKNRIGIAVLGLLYSRSSSLVRYGSVSWQVPHADIAQWLACVLRLSPPP